MNDRRQKSIAVWILCAVLIIQVLANLLWWSLNKAPVPWDQANHTQLAIRLFFCVRDQGLSPACLHVSDYYPIAAHSIAAVVFSLTGVSVVGTQFIGTGFWIFALFSIYLLMLEITRRPKLALMTVWSCSMLPVFVDVSRYFMTDLLLLGATCMAMWYLLRSRSFQGRSEVLWAGWWTAIALMTKWYAAFYLLPVYVWVFWRSRRFWRITPLRNKAVVSLSMAAAIIFAICLPWYLTNLQPMLEQTRIYAQADDSQPKELFTLTALTWYIQLAWKFQFFPWLFCLVVVGGGLYFATAWKKPFVGFVAYYVVTQYVLFSMLGNKAIRYDFHLLVFALMWLWYGLAWIKSKWRVLGLSLIAVVMIYQIFFFMVLSYRWPIRGEHRWVVKFPVIGYTELFNISTNPIYPATTYEWPTSAIAKELVARSRTKPMRVLTMVDYRQLNTSNLIAHQLELTQKANDLLSIEVLESSGYKVGDDPATLLRQYDYVLVTTNEVGYDWHREVFPRVALQKYILSENGLLTVVGRYRFPLADLDPSIIQGSHQTGDRLPRQKVCKTHVCNEILVMKVQK